MYPDIFKSPYGDPNGTAGQRFAHGFSNPGFQGQLVQTLMNANKWQGPNPIHQYQKMVMDNAMNQQRMRQIAQQERYNRLQGDQVEQNMDPLADFKAAQARGEIGPEASYQDWMQMKQAQAAQAQAASDQRELDMFRQKEQIKHDFKEPPQTPKPTKWQEVQAIMGNPDLTDEQRRMQLLTVAPNVVKDMDEMDAAEQKKLDFQQQAQRGIDLIDDLLNAEGQYGPTSAFPITGVLDTVFGKRTPLEQASGIESMLPTLPGSPAANAQAKLESLQGMNFLQAINQLRGTGQITEIEGKKAQDAVATIQTSQSDAAIKEALTTLRAILAQSAGIEMPDSTTPSGQMQIPDGYKLKQDANGNRAWVGPNNEIIEVR